MEEVYGILSELRPEFDFESSKDFIMDSLLDSFDIIMLVSELDNAFNISIDGMDIIPDNFTSVDAICKLIRKNGGKI